MLPTIPDLELHPDTPAPLVRAAHEAHRFLQGFAWLYPNGEDPRGEVTVDGENWIPRLHLEVWVHDNENPDELEVKPLSITAEIDPSEPAPEQVRALIHWFLTHEADEQMSWQPPNGGSPADLWHPHRLEPSFDTAAREHIELLRKEAGL